MKIKSILKFGVIFATVLGIFSYVAGQISCANNVERSFNSPVEKVWQVWTDTESMKKYWSPKNFTAPVIQSDFREGGSFLFSMKSPQGEMFWNTGKYTEIVPYKKIVSQMSFSDEKGNIVPAPVPGKWPEAVTVTVEFSEIDGKTNVKIQEIGIPLIMYLFAKMGWEQQLDKFAELLK